MNDLFNKGVKITDSMFSDLEMRLSMSAPAVELELASEAMVATGYFLASDVQSFVGYFPNQTRELMQI